MSRRLRFRVLGIAAVVVAAVVSACGTQTVSVPNTAADAPLHHGAELFNQRCSGCHSLSYAAANGSASNPRIAQANSGPNFNVRCERPLTRVLYAIENGGFSGAIMPQNIVVGQDAIDVAKFVATYSGRKAPKLIGVVACQQKPVGSVAVAAQTTSTSAASSSTTSTAASAAPAPKRSKSKTGKKHKRAHA